MERYTPGSFVSFPFTCLLFVCAGNSEKHSRLTLRIEKVRFEEERAG